MTWQPITKDTLLTWATVWIEQGDGCATVDGGCQIADGRVTLKGEIVTGATHWRP